MAPAMDFIQWNSSDISVKVEVNCFLPTGVLVPIMSTINTSLAEIKRQLFFEARAYPLYKKLLAPANYNFICISNKGKRETIEDERLTLRDVRPFRPFLKLVERQGVREKEMQDSKIKFLMGKTPREFDATNDVQKALFRSKYAKIAKKISDERKQKEWDDRSICAYPPDLYDSNDIPKHIAAKLVDNTFLVSVHRLTENSDGLDFHAFRDGKPSDVLAKALQIKAERLRRTVDEMSNFTLKIKGKESYLLGNFPLLQYKVVEMYLI
jgi:phosphatidylinositol-4,5-bisphosphate 3-kinase